MKLNYIIIPLYTFLVAFSGSLITGRGMNWYKTINLPSFTPSGAVIGMVWTTIFILTAVSAILVWNKFPRGKKFNLIFIIFFLNGILNVLWSFLFFGIHNLPLAFAEAILLGLSVLVLIILIRPVLRLGAVLLYLYCFWTFFASYLTYSVWMLNL